jgi:hypothetical protein
MGNPSVAHSDFTLPYYTSGFIRNTPRKKLICPFFMSGGQHSSGIALATGGESVDITF